MDDQPRPDANSDETAYSLSVGWVEFVTQQGCMTSAEVSRFYIRQGAYLAILYALEGTDFHYENLIAAGEHPILVDLETLFQPRIADIHRVSEAYKDSVLRLGLLPQRMFGSTLEGINLSGLGAAVGQALPYSIPYLEAPGTDRMRLVYKSGESSGADNQPNLAGRNIDILDYADEMRRYCTGCPAPNTDLWFVASVELSSRRPSRCPRPRHVVGLAVGSDSRTNPFRTDLSFRDQRSA